MCSLGCFLEIANSFEGMLCACFCSSDMLSALCTRVDISDKRMYLSKSCATLSRKHFVGSDTDLWNVAGLHSKVLLVTSLGHLGCCPLGHSHEGESLCQPFSFLFLSSTPNVT